MELADREWKTFKCEEIFDISGTITTQPEQLHKNGKNPRITCSSINNGIDDFYCNIPTESGNVLTIDSATIGSIMYHNYNFIATDHVEKLTLKTHDINRYIGLFLKSSILKAIKDKYGYGYKFSQSRIKNQKILLPINKLGKPDYAFMENYIKEKEKVKLDKYIKYVESLKNSRGG